MQSSMPTTVNWSQITGNGSRCQSIRHVNGGGDVNEIRHAVRESLAEGRCNWRIIQVVLKSVLSPTIN
jgi:hypothetical protein